MATIKPVTKQKAYNTDGLFVTSPRGEIIETFSTPLDARKAASLSNRVAHARAQRIAPSLGFVLVFVEGHWYLKLDAGNGLLPASDIEVRLWLALESARAELARNQRAAAKSAAAELAKAAS